MYKSQFVNFKPFQKVYKHYKDTDKYDIVMVGLLKRYFKTVLLNSKETIESVERKKWVNCYADLALNSVNSKYFEEFKVAMEDLLKE